MAWIYTCFFGFKSETAIKPTSDVFKYKGEDFILTKPKK